MGRTQQLAIAGWHYRRIHLAGAPRRVAPVWTLGWIFSCMSRFDPIASSRWFFPSLKLYGEEASCFEWHKGHTAEVGRCLSLSHAGCLASPSSPICAKQVCRSRMSWTSVELADLLLPVFQAFPPGAQSRSRRVQQPGPIVDNTELHSRITNGPV